MALTEAQRNSLKLYLDYKTELPTTTAILRKQFVRYVPVLIIGAILYFLVDWVGLLALGALTGGVLRDVVYFRNFRAVWPVHLEIINWQRVDEILNEDEIA